MAEDYYFCASHVLLTLKKNIILSVHQENFIFVRLRKKKGWSLLFYYGSNAVARVLPINMKRNSI